MNKFKKGDYIIGNDAASDRYAFTKKGWVGIVTRICVPNNIINATEVDIKTMKIDNSDLFTLESKYFDLYKPLDAAVNESDYTGAFGPIAKVGDYIRIVNDLSASGLIVGDIYIVEGIGYNQKPTDHIRYHRTFRRRSVDDFEYIVVPKSVELSIRHVNTGKLYPYFWSCTVNTNNRAYIIVEKENVEKETPVKMSLEQEYEVQKSFGTIAKKGDIIRINDPYGTIMHKNSLYKVTKSIVRYYKDYDPATKDVVVKVSVGLDLVAYDKISAADQARSSYKGWACSNNKNEKIYSIVLANQENQKVVEQSDSKELPVKVRFLKEGYKQAPEPIKKKLSTKFPELLLEKTFEEKLQAILEKEIAIFKSQHSIGRTNYISSNIKPRIVKFKGNIYIALTYPNANTDWTFEVNDFAKHLITKYSKHSEIYQIHTKSICDAVLEQERYKCKVNNLYPPSALLVLRISESIFK